MSELAIRTEGLTRDFGDVRAVSALSVSVPSGIVFGFLGPNGAGKTTTIRLLLGLIEPTSGRAQVLGYDPRTHGAEVRSRVGALLEHGGLYERMTVEDNLELFGRIWHIPPGARRARIKELLTGAGLWDRRHEVLGDWSRGMRQKVALVRTMLHRPRLIFFDEPTAGLDPIAAAAVRDDLARLAREEGVTVFLTTHNLAEAEKVCRRVAVIREGRLVAVGRPRELSAHSQRPRLQVVGRGFTEDLLCTVGELPGVSSVDLEDGEERADAPEQDVPQRLVIQLKACGDAFKVAPLVRMLVKAGVEVEEVGKVTATLEEAFLTLMNENREATP